MSVPALENGPWVFDVNNDCSESTTENCKRHVCWQTKESMVALSVWSVVASSDSSSVKNIGDASPDLWVAWANVISGTGAHSWIILENSVTGEQICIDCNTATSYRLEFAYSPTGTYSTDGTTSLRPSVTDELTILSNSHNSFKTTLDGTIVHAMMSADSKCTRVIWHQREGNLSGDIVILLEEALNTPSQWTGSFKRVTYQHIIPMVYSAINTSKFPNNTDFQRTTYLRSYQVDATPYEGWNYSGPTFECYSGLANDGGDTPFSTASYLDFVGGYPVGPIGIFRDYEARGGGLGRLQDIYWAYRNHDTYDTYDGSGPREWIKIGCLLLPWNGTTPLEVP